METQDNKTVDTPRSARSITNIPEDNENKAVPEVINDDSKPSTASKSKTKTKSTKVMT